MKRIIFAMALAVLCVASVSAKKDKKKAQQQEPVVPAVVLSNGSDSISYACGYQQTNGLINFLLQEKMDTAYMADFIRGLKEAVAKTEDPSFKAYSMGLNIAGQLKDRMLPGFSNELKDSPDSLVDNLFFEGFYASLLNDTTFFNQENSQKYFRERLEADQAAKKEALYGKTRDEGKAFLAENAKKEGVVTLPSGLQYKVLVEGTGVKPSAKEKVTVKYEGKLINGNVFDSSYKRKEQTNKFRANQVIKGWTEALQLMPVGSTWELYIPYELAYGEQGAGANIPPYSTLIFKVELVDCESAQAAAKAEEEAKAAEAKAKAVKKTVKKRK